MLSASVLALAFALAAGAETDTLLLVARDASHRQDYETAGALLSARLTEEPDSPAALFWQASLIQLLIYDSGQPALLDSFFRLSDDAVRASKRRVAEDCDDALPHLYLAMTQLNRANCQSWQNRKLKAFMTMLGVPSNLKRVTRLDSTLHDVRFGQAVIEYFKATADRYLFGLGLFGSRERAYRAMRDAAGREGRFQPMAQFMLAFMLKEDGEYAEAVEVCEALLAEYPGNRAARRLLRDSHVENLDTDLAVGVCRELEAEILDIYPDNRYGIAENRLKWGRAWMLAGEADSARVRFDQVIAWESFEDEVPWLGHYVRDAKVWRRRLDD